MTKLSEDRAFAQNYFNFVGNSHYVSEHGGKIDSNDQFGKGEIPEPAEQRELMKSFDQCKGHSNEILNLASINKTSFKHCVPHLRSGFNLLCYGFGRKVELLDEMVSENFLDFNIFTLNGFSEASLNLGPMAVLNYLLNSIQSTLFPNLSGFNASQVSKAAINNKVNLICSQRSDQRSIILIHQLDSITFRIPLLFECLLKLISTFNFSIVASIDNPGMINLFSNNRFEKFRWIWVDCTTMTPYSDELNRFALDACTNAASKQTPRAAVIVLQSLTSNSRSIFKLLAAHQLASPETQVTALIDSFEDDEDNNDNSGMTSGVDGYHGMSYHGLFQKCQENFVVTAEANFRTQLTEFSDHDLFKSMEGRDGSVMFFIPFYHPELRQIIQDI